MLHSQVVATDGDADLVRLLSKNLAHNNGEASAADRLQQRRRRQKEAAAETQPENAAQEHEEDSSQPAHGVQGPPQPADAAQVLRFRHRPRSLLLPWGREQAVRELRDLLFEWGEKQESDMQQQQTQDLNSAVSRSRRGVPDFCLLAEVIYGR